MPAVLVALALTFSRNAWVGACAGISLLFVLRDFRLVAVVPVAAALFLAFAPAQIADRLYSTFSLTDPTNVDRLAMIRSGLRIIKDDPADGGRAGHGDPGLSALPRSRRGQPARSRTCTTCRSRLPPSAGSPALGAWLWFIVVLVRDLLAQDAGPSALRSLPTAALAAVVAMLAAGMFEYNFGDSEFLMLFLLLVTLPYAADRAPGRGARRPPSVASRLTMTAFDALLDRIAGRSILVVGDLMLDHFVYGRVDPDFA